MLKLTTLLLVRLLSYTGSYLGFLAMNVFILGLGFDEKFLAYIFLLRVASAVISLPIIGYISDRWNRQIIMVITDFIMAISVVLLIFMPKNHLKFYIPIFMLLAGTLSNVFDITLNSAIPVILGKRNQNKLLKINSWMLAGKHSAIVISGILIALSFHIFRSYYAIFTIDAISYLASGLTILLLNIQTQEKRIQQAKMSFRQHFKTIFIDYNSVKGILKNSIILAGLSLIFADTFASSSHNIAWPVISKLLNKENPSLLYGLIITVWGLGNIIGISILNNKHIYKHKNTSIEKTYLYAHIVMLSGFIGAVLSNKTGIILGFAILGGVGDGINKSLMTLYLQEFKDSIRGKLFAIANTTNRVGFTLGFVIINLTLNYISIRPLTVILYSLPVTLSIIYLTKSTLNQTNDQQTR